jgi:hypothetical protein
MNGPKLLLPAVENQRHEPLLSQMSALKKNGGSQLSKLSPDLVK